jgi:hypothetical protein
MDSWVAEEVERDGDAGGIGPHRLVHVDPVEDVPRPGRVVALVEEREPFRPVGREQPVPLGALDGDGAAPRGVVVRRDGLTGTQGDRGRPAACLRAGRGR